jgi:phosphoglycolate phosphatase-like HAD superfamily hydrolase
MSARRLVLWDIDGTILSPGLDARRAFGEALVEVFGTSGNLEGFRFEGKLDPMIVDELMTEAGLDPEVIAKGTRTALARYLDRLEEVLGRQKPTLKPGARALVEAVAADPGSVNAILTGNVERGARIKLTSAELWHHFVFGVFGDEAPRRVDLGSVALARARSVTGITFSGAECVVVGDSRHDVECGLALGARVIAVATGKTTLDELGRAGATILFENFSDFEAAREAILC